jgi:signal transduction histidine kinase
MLLNLLKNAITHTPAGGQVRVAVNYVNEADSNKSNLIKVSVEDTGIGITDSKLLKGKGEAMFNNAGVENIGFGLHIVKKLATNLGGTVVCTSDG